MLNKNNLILILIIFFAICYLCFKKKTKENMTTVEGEILKKGELINAIFDVEPEDEVKDNLLVDKTIAKIIEEDGKITTEELPLLKKLKEVYEEEEDPNLKEILNKIKSEKGKDSGKLELLEKGFVVTKKKKGTTLGNVKNRIGNYKFEKEHNKAPAFTNGKYKIFYGSGNDGWQWVKQFNRWAGNGPSIDEIKSAKDFVDFKGFVVESSKDKEILKKIKSEKGKDLRKLKLLKKGFVVTKKKKGTTLGNVKNRIGNYKFEKVHNKAPAFTNGKYKIFYGSGNDGWQWVKQFNRWAGDGPSIDEIKSAKDFVDFKGFVVELSKDKEISEEVLLEDNDKEISEEVQEEVYHEEEQSKNIFKFLKEKIKKKREMKDIMNKTNTGGYWEHKKFSIEEVLDFISKYFKDCSVNDIKIKSKLVSKAKNRKQLIEILPLLKVKFRSNIKYEDVKCLVAKYDSKNFINNHIIQENLPKYFPHKNCLIINNFLYTFTSMGVIKYKIESFDSDERNHDIINGSFEATFINDINIYNTTDAQIVPFRGKILKINDDKFINIINDKEVNILKNKEILHEEESLDSISLLKKSVLKDESVPDEYFDQILFIMSHKNTTFVIKPNKVFPNIGMGVKLNKYVEENRIVIKGVVPQIFYVEGKLNIRYLFLTTNSFYFILSKNNISELKDLKKDYGITVYDKIDYPINCDDKKLLLNQMVISKLIPKSKRDAIIKSLDC